MRSFDDIKNELSTLAIIERITSYPLAKRMRLQHDANAHATAECNGDYYQDEDTGAWHGYNHFTYKWDDGSIAEQLAKRGAHREENIPKRIAEMCQAEAIPDFISWQGDPRGYVLKIKGDKISDEARTRCHDLGFSEDWGNDFSIIKRNEWK